MTEFFISVEEQRKRLAKEKADKKLDSHNIRLLDNKLLD